MLGGLRVQAEVEWAPLWRDTTNAEGGRHVQVLGPIFEEETVGPVRWEAFRPLAVKFYNEDTGTESAYLLPPFLSWHNSEDKTRWSIMFVISGTEERDAEGEIEETTFSIFPFVFRDRNAQNAEDNTFAVFPLYGTINNSLLLGSFSFVAFPAYLNMHRPEAERYGAPWPLIQWQEGPEAGGFALWPLGGHFYQKDKYDHQFAFWPFIYRDIDQMDQPQPRIRQGFLPLYAIERSATVEDVSIIWPFFGWREEFDSGYYEQRLLWPLWVQGEGPNQTFERWLPFYSEEITPERDDRWYAWPFFHQTQARDDAYRFERTQVLYIMYWEKEVYSLENPEAVPSTLLHMWPFYSEYSNGKGLTQAQFPSPLAVFFPNSEVVKKLYSPLFTFYRMQRDEVTGVTEQGYFWDFIHETKTEDSTRFTLGPIIEHDVAPGRAKFSLLDGLFGVERNAGVTTFSLLWFTID